MLDEIFDLQARTNVNIMVTSKLRDVFQRRFAKYPLLLISAAHHDVQAYLAAYISCMDGDFVDNEIRHSIQIGVAETAEGMYVIRPEAK